MKDKNGRKLKEGDLVKWDGNKKRLFNIRGFLKGFAIGGAANGTPMKEKNGNRIEKIDKK